MACQKVYKQGKVDSDGLPIHKASFMRLAMHLKIILSEWLHTNHAKKNEDKVVSSVGIDVHCIGACKLKCMHRFKWLCLILKGEIYKSCLCVHNSLPTLLYFVCVLLACHTCILVSFVMFSFLAYERHTITACIFSNSGDTCSQC